LYTALKRQISNCTDDTLIEQYHYGTAYKFTKPDPCKGYPTGIMVGLVHCYFQTNVQG